MIRGQQLLSLLTVRRMTPLPPGGTPFRLAAAAHARRAFDFVLGDARKIDWSGADCLFMNSTCFDEPLMLELAAVGDNMRVGSFAITFTKRLPSAKWEVCESEVHVMSWGTATVFIHKKVVP